MNNPEEKQKINTEVVGTPDYLAPEVLLGLGHCKFLFDKLSLFLTVYSIYSGLVGIGNNVI